MFTKFVRAHTFKAVWDTLRGSFKPIPRTLKYRATDQPIPVPARHRDTTGLCLPSSCLSFVPAYGHLVEPSFLASEFGLSSFSIRCRPRIRAKDPNHRDGDFFDPSSTLWAARYYALRSLVNMTPSSAPSSYPTQHIRASAGVLHLFGCKCEGGREPRESQAGSHALSRMRSRTSQV